jgi:hypothetical protein
VRRTLVPEDTVSPDRPFRPTVFRVVAVEILCVLILWWIGRTFGA